jgi:hypothetical protein
MYVAQNHFYKNMSKAKALKGICYAMLPSALLHFRGMQSVAHWHANFQNTFYEAAEIATGNIRKDLLSRKN